MLLHPLDFLGAEDVSALRFFPGMDLPRDDKLALVGECLDLMGRHYDLVTMREHARRTGSTGRLRLLEPDFAPAIPRRMS
jgi:hypothetical protein